MIEVEFKDLKDIVGVDLSFEGSEGDYSFKIYSKDYFMNNDKIKERSSKYFDGMLFLVENERELNHLIGCLSDLPDEKFAIIGYKKVRHEYDKKIYFETVNFRVRVGSVQSYSLIYKED